MESVKSCSSDWPCAALPSAELGARTTLKVGGAVEWLVEPKTPEELVAAVAHAREAELDVRVLGGGANLLIVPELLPGCVISTELLNRTFRPTDLEAGGELDGSDAPLARVAPELASDDPRLVLWAGARLQGLVRTAYQLGLRGAELLSGVPGHVGGALAMNAGSRDWGFWDQVERVWLLDPATGEVSERAREECAPSYRNGNLQGQIALACVLRFEPDDKAALKAEADEYLRAKCAAQPVTERSAGCVWKNPDPELSDGRGAGKLVDDLGLTGLKLGRAMVSPQHGNFVLNAGDATGVEVLALIEEVEARVLDATGIELKREVCLWESMKDDTGGGPDDKIGYSSQTSGPEGGPEGSGASG